MGGTTLYEWDAHDIPVKTWWKPTISTNTNVASNVNTPPRSPHWGRDKDDDGELREAVFLEAEFMVLQWDLMAGWLEPWNFPG